MTTGRGTVLATLALLLVLPGAYTFSIGLRASRSAEISGDEPFYLATTQSIIDDRNFDLREQYERESYREFFDHPDGLWKQALAVVRGRLMRPHDPGLAVLLVPGFALGGLRGAQVELMLIAAATFALAFACTASGFGHPRTAWLMTATCGLAAPAFVYSTEIYPEIPAAFCLVAALAALRLAPGYWRAAAMVAALTGLAWLGMKYLPLGLIVAAAYAWQAPARERSVFAGAAAASSVLYLWAYVALFGAFTPYNGNLVHQGASTASVVQAHVGFEDRVYRIWGLFVDQRFGLGRWAPILLAVLPSLPLLSGRSMGRLVAALIAAQVLVAAFVAVTMMGWWFPGRHLMVVYPLFPVVLTLAAAQLPVRMGALWGALGAWSLAITAGLALAGHRGDVRVATDPFELDFLAFRALAPLFPDYTWWTTETQVLNAVWVAVFGALAAAAVWRIRNRGERRRRLFPGRTMEATQPVPESRSVTAPRG